jgi:ribonuclease P protein component
MLAKKFRLPIQTVFAKKGRHLKSDHFLVKIFPNQLSYPRVGVVVSKKVDARASARNRIRRQILDEARRNIALLPEGKDILIVVSSSFAKLEKTDSQKHLREFFAKLK